jgi:NAD(P)-dependent dehydrogenase (short-subunit alcohol dehydrogenase family)
MSARDYSLHLVARDEVRLAAIASELQATYTVGDVRDPALFARVAAEAGDELQGLVYAVGTLRLGSLQRLTREAMLEDFSINALGAALAVQASLSALKKGEGTSSIVLFSSVAVTQGFGLHTSMGLAKGAVAGLARALAAELAPRIRVNAIAPSLTKTPLAEGILANPTLADSIARQHPMQRLGTAEDIASMTTFLMTPESGWITGQVFGVDGGRSTLQLPV